jgi:hypothetical protein
MGMAARPFATTWSGVAPTAPGLEAGVAGRRPRRFGGFSHAAKGAGHILAANDIRANIAK